jgi:hypothetical protein
VSIAEAIRGIPSVTDEDIWVETIVSLGKTEECLGSSKTSSKVNASGISMYKFIILKT